MTTPQLVPALALQCAGRVYRQLSSNWGNRSGCEVRAKYHEDGKDWCGIHLPSNVLLRDNKRAQEHEAGWEAQLAIRKRRDAERAALAGIANPAAVPEVIAAARVLALALAPERRGLTTILTLVELYPTLGRALAALDKS